MSDIIRAVWFIVIFLPAQPTIIGAPIFKHFQMVRVLAERAISHVPSKNTSKDEVPICLPLGEGSRVMPFREVRG
jgi:hypothetical protein